MTVAPDRVLSPPGEIEVTVVVATYRRPDRLGECLNGLRSQRRPPDEVVVVVHADDETTVRAVSPLTSAWPRLRIVCAERRGSVAAYNCGLTAARGSIVAYVDDDAVPAPDWIQQILETFGRDERIAAVGGRDMIVSGGRVLGVGRRFGTLRGKVPVGRIQWFGRMIANHHVGEGPPRYVDVLKGVNMSFRRAAVIGHGFDERLRGEGVQMHSELSICLPLRRRGFRIVYDPSIVVEHRPAPRPRGDHRAVFIRQAELDTAHNEALQVLDHFGPPRRVLYGIWGLAVGTTGAPGLAVLGRDLMRGRPAAWSRFRASQRGRAAAWRTRRTPRQVEGGHDTVPRLLHRPQLTWRRRHVFGALGLRPAVAQHSQAEAQLLMRYAADARTLVELGVAEGASAAELRSVMSPMGRLYLVDPYERGRLGVSMALLVAARTVRAVRRGEVTWRRMRSDEAVRDWHGPIDFLFIDADHSYERAAGDWRAWAPFVRPGGHVALHDSVVFAGGWTNERSGPVRLLEEIRREQGWTLVDQADSLSILGRDGSPRENGADAQRGLHILRVADVENIATAGMSGYMLSSGSEIERRGHRVTYWFRDQLVPAMASPGLRRLLVPWLIAAKVTSALLRGERFDVVEIHEPLSAAYGVLARILSARLPLCAVLSFGLTERFWQAERGHLRVYGRSPRLRSRVLVPLTLISQARVGLRTADAVLVPATADRDYLIREMGVPPERVTCAYTGVADPLFDVKQSAHSDVRVLFLGSWIERKGTIELVEAWRRLAAERENVRLTLAGVVLASRARADVRGLARVELIPSVERDELPRLLAAHDVFVLASWFEGMPLAMLEAAAAGLACVVSSVCGNLDVFRPEDPARDGAILIPPSDADALYRALIALVDDGQLLADLGARARERARRFTWSRTAEQTLDAFTDARRRRGVSVP